MKIFLTFIFLISSLHVWAISPQQITFSLGTITTSFSESETKLVASDGTADSSATPYSGSATSMPFDICYEYFPNLTRSYFISAGGPIVGTTPDRYLYTNIGINFYFSLIGASSKVTDQSIELNLSPTLRYYAGPKIGVSYLIYNTKSATKNDTALDVGGNAGVLYSIIPKWDLRAQLDFTRGIGGLTSSTTIKILFGMTYNFAQAN